MFYGRSVSLWSCSQFLLFGNCIRRNAMLPLRFFKKHVVHRGKYRFDTGCFLHVWLFLFLESISAKLFHGYSPLQSGVRLLPMAIAAFIGAMFSARLAQQIGTKLTVALGILIAACGLYYFNRIAAVNTGYLKIAIGMCITSLGMGVTMSPATNSIMGSVPVDEAGVGSAMNDTNRQIGGALGVAILGTLLNSAYAASIDKIVWPAPASRPSADNDSRRYPGSPNCSCNCFKSKALPWHNLS